jgi:glycosyltransferase involved in cell wall biosynthesis
MVGRLAVEPALSLSDAPTDRMTPTPAPRTVVTDARMLAYPLTGIGRYVLELLRRLVARPGTRWVLLSARPVPPALREEFVGDLEWIEGSSSQRAELWMQRTAARELRRRPGAIFLGLANSVPFLAPRRSASCLIIYDLSFLVVPRLTDAFDLVKAFLVTVPSIWAAGRIVAISQAVEYELLRYFPGRRGCTSALPLGGTRMSSGAMEPFERRSGFLAVGAHRRKNVGMLLRAYAELPREMRAQHPLHIVARRLPGHLDRLVQRLQLTPDVRLNADLDDGQLGALYSQCLALVYPSAYEGLGLPVAEAMLSGLPSIVPAGSPMEGFLDGAGIVLQSLEVGTLVEAMRSLATRRDVWDQCAARATAAAVKLGWDRVADAAARAMGL